MLWHIVRGGEGDQPPFYVKLPSLPTARHGLASVVINNVLYVIGGGRWPGLSVSGINKSLQLS